MDDKCKKLWDKYTEAYNELSDKMVLAGIDTKLLRRVVSARSDFDIQDNKVKLRESLKSLI